MDQRHKLRAKALKLLEDKLVNLHDLKFGKGFFLV